MKISGAVTENGHVLYVLSFTFFVNKAHKVQTMLESKLIRCFDIITFMLYAELAVKLHVDMNTVLGVAFYRREIISTLFKNITKSKYV